MKITRRRIGGLLLVGLVTALTGCGPSFVQVTVKVTYKGQPVPGGTVLLQPVDSKLNSITGDLDNDGTFAATLPIGDLLVMVDNSQFAPSTDRKVSMPPPSKLNLPPEVLAKIGGRPAGPETAKEVDPNISDDGPRRITPSKRFVAIPSKYFQLETSGLTITVKKDEPVITIELTD